MKKLLIILVMLFSVSILSAQETQMTHKEKKASKKAELIEKTKSLVEAGAWQFDATRMLPSSGRARTLTTSYRVVVKDSLVDSYLPYFGRAYSAEYGSSESPMSFKGEISDIKVEESKKGGWMVTFKTTNKNDRLDLTFFISETGSVNLTVNSTNRQAISYYGDLSEIDMKK